jgi:hypothetical protein
MRLILAFATLIALAACGADGAPQPPGTTTGVTVTGEVSAGVVAGG